MSKISIYEVVPVPKLADKLVGTSVGGDPEDITYNFTLSELLNLFIPNIPGNTLQGVLDFGNTATQDINLTGIITTTTLNVGSTANILNSNLTGQTHITGGLYDRLNSIGTAGQVLTSTGTQVEWYTIPTVIPNLQQVLTSGNTAVNNIILTGNLSANNAALLTSTISTSLTLLGTVKDGLNSVGTNNQVLSSNVTGVRWINLPVYSATSPLLYNSGTGVFSIQQAGASQDGYLSSADWITFDGKQTSISLTTTGNSGASTLVGATINVPNYTLSGLGGVPQTRTLTINGVTFNLSADRTWTLATGVSSVSATTPLFSTGGANPDISIQQSSSTLNGYLSSTDWLTFNSKQPAGNYITSLTGEATAVGPGAAAVILSNAAVIGKLLTGLSITGSAITSSDSILTAFGKVQNQINGLIGGVQFQGVWNAATNTPALVSSVGTQGYYYIVSVAGNTNLNGITDWQVGDWAIFNGSTWNKVDNTDLVTSVNGQIGAVSLTTDNIPEGATNLYYLDSRARAALSFAAGSGAYNSTTGVITIPTDNSQILNGAGYITLVSLSATSPLTYNNTTGAFAIQVANTTQDGYLSSTDWNTFNGKQPFLGGTGLVKSVAGVISYITDNSANWNTAYNDSIVSAAVTGTATKTLTLNQQDGGTITASWSDIDTGLTSVGVSMPSAFTVTNSPLTSNGTIAITGSGNTLQYVDGTGALQSFPSLTGYVPYTGATANVNLGIYNLTAASLIKNGGTSGQFLKADGSVDSSAYIVLGSLSATAPLSYNNTTGVFTISQSGTTTNGYLSSIDWNTFNNKQATITLTTTGSSGASTLIGNTLNIPNYANLVTSVFGRIGAVVATEGDYSLTQLSDVTITTPSSGQVLKYNGTAWVNDIDTDTGITSLNGLTALTQTFAVGTSGTDFAISSVTSTHTFNLPTASVSNRGALSSADWTTFNSKEPAITAGTTLQYYRGDKTFQTLNTTVVPEGTNLYYLDSRARTAISLTTTGSSGASTYNNTTGVFNIPDYGSALSGYVPTSRQLSINGTQYDLSADRSWSVGTVTTVSFTLGGTGTDLNSSVVNSTTTPAITLNVPTASAANRGALSAADWSTFNTKVGGVTATTPLFSSGGSTPNLTIQQSSGSQAGYLSSTDWTTFNNKQAAGNYITSLTGEATATGPGAAAVTLDNAAVTGKILTGVNITGGTILSTDSILTGFGKLQNQVNGLIGGSIYQGTWNANTNTPTLTSSVGTAGYYYIVSVAGTTNLNGITDWQVGDWAIFNGGVWQKVDNTDSVISVNGQTGAVSLTTDNISEGVTNLYYTDTRARAALSFVAGSGAYNSSTGAITIPTNTSQLTNGANFITLASLSGTAPITYNSGTGAISITQAATASNGYLSSTDWNTFNNKQATITLTTTGTSGASTLIGATLNIPDYGSALSGYVTLATAQTISGSKTFSGTSLFTGSATFNSALQATIGIIFPTSGTVSNGAGVVGLGAYTGGLRTAFNGGYTSDLAFQMGANYVYTFPAASGTIALVGGSGVGTVTSVAALTIGTTGTDLSSTVANSTTTPVITLNVPTASAANRGALSSADWTTFNNKQATISLTTTGTSGAATLVGATLNIPQYQSVITNPVTGTGLTNYVARWTSTSNISTGILIDNGTIFWVGAGSAGVDSRMTVNQPATGFASPVVLRIENENTTQSESAIRFRAKSSGGLNSHADVGVYATGTDTGKFFIKFPYSDSQQTNVKFSITETGVVDMVNYFNIINSGGFYSLIKSTGASQSVGLNLGNNNIAKWGMHIQTTDRFAIFNYGTSTAPLSIDYSTNYIYALQRIGIGIAAPTAALEINGSGFGDGLAIITTSVNGADIKLQNTGAGGEEWHITSTGSNNDTGAGNLQFWNSTDSATRFVLKGTGQVGINVNPSAWVSTFNVLQIGQTGSLHQSGTDYSTRVSNNIYWDGADWRRLVSSYGSMLNLTNSGGFIFYSATTGSAGGTVALTTPLTVSAGGDGVFTGSVTATSFYGTNLTANFIPRATTGGQLANSIMWTDNTAFSIGQAASGGAQLTLNQDYTTIVSPTVLRLQNSHSIAQMRIRGLNAGYFAHADVGVYADGTAQDAGYWFVKFPYSDGLTNIRLKINQAGQATFNAASATNTLIVNGAAGNFSAVMYGNTTTGSSYGLGVYAGTNSSDDSFRVHNISNALYFSVKGDGVTQVGTGVVYSGAPTYSKLVVGSQTTSDAGITIQSTSTTISRLFFLDAADNGSILRQDHSTNYFEIFNGGSRRFFMTSTGVTTFTNLAGTGSRMVIADSTGALSTQAIPTGTVTGTGTTNYLPKFTGASTIGNSLVYDTGSEVLIGTATRITGLSGFTQFEVSSSEGGIAINSNTTTTEKYSRLMFTKSGATGNEGLIRYNVNDYHMAFWTNASEKMRITSGGNLGLGVTPSSGWRSTDRVIQLQQGAIIKSQTDANILDIGSNFYINTSNQFIYLNTDFASRYVQYQSEHQWFTAPSGTAGSFMTLTQAMTLFATGNLSIGAVVNSNKLYIANGTTGTIPVYLDIAYAGSTPFFGGIQTVRSNTNTVGEGAGYHVGAMRADLAVVEYGGIGVQIESNGNSTYSGKTSLLIAENGTQRVAKATLSSQLGFVVNPGLTSSTFSSNGNQSLSGTNKFTAAGGSTWNNGGTWAGTVGSNIINFSGSNTINNGAVVAGFIGVNRIAFDSASLTVTLNQSTGIRALAGMQTLMQTGGSNAGTVSHGASLLVQGVYPTGSANITFTNYYGILINPLDEWGTVTFTNRWGIYQAGSSDKNYFAGIMQKPNQPTFSVKNSSTIVINSTDSKLAFNSEYFDVGNNYNTTLYRFTAPYTGKYLITFEASMVSGGGPHTYNAIYILKNGAGTSFRFRGPSNLASGNWFGISGSVVMDLTAGDYLELSGYTDSSSMDIQGNEGCWSGYYLG